ncbi:nitroreductase family protein [Cohnella sp. REN36]|uniref:nitroreductase family protein n=1 Tax=Cohnella sp. REN36 TaxID=2887347 RepID=UPI001D146888|nr:nitroreductase family protein [Cohnella sp. REN36]MCC3375090.1 nitroreductase family protein [Cohnella sp. REN36]
MDIFEAIKGRRSIGKVKSDPVPRELVEQIIEAAVWAPNHFHTEPWKFVVMTGEGRRTLGRAYADIAAEGWAADMPADERADRIAREEAKAFRSPVVVAAISAPTGEPRAILAEERAAAHAAVQNLLLAAHALGLGAVWRTGEPAYHPKMQAAFGLEGQEEVVGLVYLGYPDMTPAPAKRVPGTEKTVWLA